MKPIVKRILLIMAALLLVAYVGYQAYTVFRPKLETATVTQVTAYQTLETDGVVFRDETIITENPSGYLYYSAQNGSRVSRGGKIADIFASENDALAQQNLKKLDAEIASLASINAQGTSNRANLTAINQQIDDIWLQITGKAKSLSFDGMEDLHSRLLTLLNKQQITVGRVENYDAQLNAMRAERQQLATSFSPASGQVSAPVAGYFIGDLDGYETYCSTKGVTELTVARVQEALNYQPQNVSSGIGKIVADYEWYLACVLPLEQAAELKMGTQIEVRMPFVSNQIIPMQVTAINKDASGQAALILKCTNMDQSLSTVRVEKIEIRLKQYDGLRIPDSAIRFNEQHEQGVYVQVGNVLAFRRIRVLYHDAAGAFSVCQVPDDDMEGYVALYDKIAVKGEDLYDGKLAR
ncbi:MAG: hypothetical protein IKB04_00630 [Clostridia bacterium]|nr:hypothetical protein [Clostridia bacterium]